MEGNEQNVGLLLASSDGNTLMVGSTFICLLQPNNGRLTKKMIEYRTAVCHFIRSCRYSYSTYIIPHEFVPNIFFLFRIFFGTELKAQKVLLSLNGNLQHMSAEITILLTYGIRQQK